MRVKSRKALILLALTAVLLPLLFACSGGKAASGSGLVVNEIVSSNKRSLVDNALGTPDWIELYNAGSETIDLSGYGVSDNLRDLHKFVFPKDTSIAPGEYMLLYATTAEEPSDNSAFCTNFGLSKSGDFLFITDPYYGIVTQMEIPPLYTDVSYVRESDGTYGFCAVPSPGKENTGEFIWTLDAVFAAQNLKDISISEVLPRTAAGTTAGWSSTTVGKIRSVSRTSACRTTRVIRSSGRFPPAPSRPVDTSAFT